MYPFYQTVILVKDNSGIKFYYNFEIILIFFIEHIVSISILKTGHVTYLNRITSLISSKNLKKPAQRIQNL